MVERDGNQRLKLVVLDCLKIFREIMRHPEWMDQFDLTSNCPPPPPSLSLNFDGESTLRWFAPVAAAVPGRRSSRWPCAPTRRGARMAPAALLDWLAATPLHPHPRSPPPSPYLDRASDLRGPSCPAAMRTLAAPPPCCSPASPCHRPAALTVSLWRPGAPTGCCGGPARRPFAILIGPATSGATGSCPAAMRTHPPPRRPAEVLPRCLTVPQRSQSHRETVPRHWWRWQTAFPAPAPAAASLSRCPAASPDRATTAGLGHGHARQGAGAVVSPVRGGVGNPGPAGRGPPGPPDRLEGRE